LFGGTKAFPEEKFQINGPFADFFTSCEKMDTFLFKGENNQVDTFAITKLDSAIFNIKGGIMAQRPRKQLILSYKQIPVNYWAETRIEKGPGNTRDDTITCDAVLIYLDKFPDDSTMQFFFSFRHFHATVYNEFPALNRDTIRIDAAYFTDYYKIQDYDQRDSAEPYIIYITPKDGFIAYQNRYGKRWIRESLH
jgi:hypothetical protein